MKVLLTGGNTSLQRSVITALVADGHEVRLLSRDSEPLTGEWSAQVTPCLIDAAVGAALRDAAGGCEAAIVIDESLAPGAGALGATPRQIADALWTADVARLICVSSSSGRRRRWPRPVLLPGPSRRPWLIIDAPAVYGISDDAITLFLIMMRSLPAVPILSGHHVLRPIWHEDFARALTRSLSLPERDLNHALRIVGPDAITQPELYERLAGLIDRRPARIPVPDFIAVYGARLADALRWSVPFEASHLPFAQAAATDVDEESHGLADVFGITGTTLEEGLPRVIRELGEATPAEGVGSMEVKRFSTDIAGSRYGAAELLRQFRMRFADVMPVPVGIEPVSPARTLTDGGVVAIALPGRGHVQVRVHEIAENRVVVATLRGHALAGIVRFSTRALDQAVRFEIMTCDAAANAFDWFGLTLGGARLQDANWSKVVENVAAMAGGRHKGVQFDKRTLVGEEAASAWHWIESVVHRHAEPA